MELCKLDILSINEINVSLLLVILFPFEAKNPFFGAAALVMKKGLNLKILGKLNALITSTV